MSYPIAMLNSLKTRISLGVLVFVLAGIWALAIYATRIFQQGLENELGTQQFSTVSMVATQINRELETRIEILRTVADLASQPLQKSHEATQDFLENHKDLLHLFNEFLYVSNRDGVSVAAIPYDSKRIGVNYSDRQYLEAVLRNGEVFISDPIRGRTSQAPVIVIAVPVLDSGGALVGAISGVINLGVPNFFDQISNSRHGKTGGFLLVVPKQRLIAAATQKERVMEQLPSRGENLFVDRFLEGYEGSARGVDPLGVEILASVRKIPLTGWLAAIVMPVSEAFEPIRKMQTRVLSAAFIMTLLLAGLVWWMLKKQLAPLSKASRVLAGMASTEDNLQPLQVVRQDEIGMVFKAFNLVLESLRQRELLLKQILDTSSVAIFLVDLKGKIIQANQRMAEMFDIPLEQILGSEYVSLVHSVEREIARQRMTALINSDISSVSNDRMYSRADGTLFWGHLTGRLIQDAQGQKQGLVGVIIDISERKAAEEQLKLAASVFTHAREGITISAADGTIIEVNDAFSRITGFSREEAVGQNPRILKSNHHSPDFYVSLWQQLMEKGSWSGEIWNRRKNGELFPELLTISAVRNDEGVTQHYVAVFTDISPMKAHEKQLEQLAHYDLLTTLPNRVLLADRLQQAMAQAHRRKQRLAVVYLDLDGFKAVNDNFGHKVGDQLLVSLATRMKHQLREGDTLARLGGDEFVAVLMDLGDVARSIPWLNRLLESVEQPVLVEDNLLRVSASIGVTFFPQAEDVDADQLLRQADQSMYQAKVSGKNRFHFFDAEQDRSVRGLHKSLGEIRKALQEDQFVLYYQPKVNMRTGVTLGMEALIRWQHPEQGLLPPSAFLPLIEDHNLSIDLGEWVINTALRQIGLWRAEGLVLPVSVNIGARQLQQRDFALRLRTILENHSQVEPENLELEVLETSSLEDLNSVSRMIASCQALGVRVALDDFGTGYSSLTYLKHLSIDMLKIDQSFVRGMLDDPQDLAILEGVLGLATAFRREVIAEGVETIEHGKMLLHLGCEKAQGYGIARPMPASAVPAWFHQWRPAPSWSNAGIVSREGLSIIYACTEHRAWVLQVEAFIFGHTSCKPEMDGNKCRFGIWLTSDTFAIFHANSAKLDEVIKLHESIHGLARELMILSESGKQETAKQRISELHVLRDAMLRLMLEQINQNSVSAT